MNYQEEEKKLDEAVDAFAAEMKRRLFDKIRQGYIGWDNPKSILDAELLRGIRDDVGAKCIPSEKFIDIANRSMMMWFRKR